MSPVFRLFAQQNNQRKWTLIFFLPERAKCTFRKKLPDKAMAYWKKFQLPSAIGLRYFDYQTKPTLMGVNPLTVVQCWDL